MLHLDPFTRHASYTLWRLEAHPIDPSKKPIKVPVHFDGKTRHSLGRPARGALPPVAPNPAPPLTAAQAEQWLAHNLATGVGHDRPGEAGYLGVGFRPAGTGLACLDIDDCLVGGAWSPVALEMMALFPGALLELSTSGKGLHIWFSYTGESPGRHGKDATGLLELYSEGQFIASGTVLQGSASADGTAAMRGLVERYWPGRAAGVQRVVANDWAEKSDEQRAETVEHLRSALRLLAGDNTYDYHLWVDYGMALASLGDEGNALWHEFSSWHPVYDYETTEHKWHQLNPDRTDYRALFAKAERVGWQNPNKREVKLATAMAGIGAEMFGASGGSTVPLAVSRPNPMGTSATSAPAAIVSGAHLAGQVTDVAFKECETNQLIALNQQALVATNSIASPQTTMGAPPPPPPVDAGGFGATAPYEPPVGVPPPPLTGAYLGPPAATGLDVESLSFAAAAEGAIAATLPNIVDALSSAESSVRLGYDEFLGAQTISPDGVTWRRISNEDAPLLRCQMERRGFKSISPEIMKSSLAILCARNRYDSARDWAEGLRWDGVPRIALALHTYYGVKDSPYSRAVSLYLFTALAGRAIEPGCQADMVPVLVGLQGAKKTSAVRILAPISDSFLAVDLSKRDDDLSRRLKGKLVAEWPELRGLAGREVQAVRAWITTRQESWVEKYETVERTFGRRFIVIGTANEEEFLDDAEGERRWLPAKVGRSIDVEGLERDRDQLWAEGVALWQQSGVQWRDAESLARQEHAEFKVTDEWTPIIERWLEGTATVALQGDPFAEQVTGRPRGDDPFTIMDVARHCLHLPTERVDRKVELRIGKVLRTLKFRKNQIWADGRKIKRWIRDEVELPLS